MTRMILALLFLVLSSSNLYAQADFYKGKTVRIVVGSTSGGLHDLWARLLAQYLPKHIAGSPEIIVQNMAGGGGGMAPARILWRWKS